MAFAFETRLIGWGRSSHYGCLRFGESRKNLQVRLSANNALNHVQITGFGTTYGTSTFGLPSSATGTRTVSLLMRFSF